MTKTPNSRWERKYSMAILSKNQAKFKLSSPWRTLSMIIINSTVKIMNSAK